MLKSYFDINYKFDRYLMWMLQNIYIYIYIYIYTPAACFLVYLSYLWILFFTGLLLFQLSLSLNLLKAEGLYKVKR